ncbi:MAG: hypothetical protein Q9218_001956 [Villophora microphyllina]
MASTPSSNSASKDKSSPAPSSRTSVETETADVPTTSIPTAYVSDKADDSSKLRTFLSILRKQCNWEVEDNSPSVIGDSPKVSATGEVNTDHKTVRVSYITEQTSHHPPVSAFWVDCPVKGISARGFDQLSAKFTGTTVRVIPGAHNLGIFINIQHRDDEEYRLTHPAAQLAVILHYLDEGWLGKAQNRVLGVVFHYDPDKDNTTKIKDVSEKDVLARLEGCWQDRVRYTLKDSKDSHLLIDLNPLWPIPKIIPPQNQQLPNESRRFWHGVTEAILNKQFGQATKLKQELEERQREKATARKDKGSEFQPRFFTEALMPNGKPELTEEGRRALKGLQENNFHLEENV